jgi:hypothetical protein
MANHRRNLPVGIAAKTDIASLKECTKPQNQVQIEQRKKAFHEAKKSGGKEKGNGNWTPLTPEERNRRIINDKPMFFIQKTQCWQVDKKSLPLKQPANAATNVPLAVPPAPLAPVLNQSSFSDANKAGKELAVANYTHQINLAIQVIASVTRDAQWFGRLSWTTSVARTLNKDPGKLDHQMWWYGLIFLLLMFSPDTWSQACQNLMFITIGMSCIQTQDWKLIKKVGRMVILENVKKRKKDKISRYIFQRPSQPPSRMKKQGRRNLN